MPLLLRLALLITAIALVVLFLYSPMRFRRIGKRLKVVGFAYVAAILIGAALRLLGFYGT